MPISQNALCIEAAMDGRRKGGRLGRSNSSGDVSCSSSCSGSCRSHSNTSKGSCNSDSDSSIHSHGKQQDSANTASAVVASQPDQHTHQPDSSNSKTRCQEDEQKQEDQTEQQRRQGTTTQEEKEANAAAKSALLEASCWQLETLAAAGPGALGAMQAVTKRWYLALSACSADLIWWKWLETYFNWSASAEAKFASPWTPKWLYMLANSCSLEALSHWSFQDVDEMRAAVDAVALSAQHRSWLQQFRVQRRCRCCCERCRQIAASSRGDDEEGEEAEAEPLDLCMLEEEEDNAALELSPSVASVALSYCEQTPFLDKGPRAVTPRVLFESLRFDPVDLQRVMKLWLTNDEAGLLQLPGDELVSDSALEDGNDAKGISLSISFSHTTSDLSLLTDEDEELFEFDRLSPPGRGRMLALNLYTPMNEHCVIYLAHPSLPHVAGRWVWRSDDEGCADGEQASRRLFQTRGALEGDFKELLELAAQGEEIRLIAICTGVSDGDRDVSELKAEKSEESLFGHSMREVTAWPDLVSLQGEAEDDAS